MLNARFHGLLVLVWIGIGALLRFVHLDDKVPWSDEWATLVFSLGHSFRSISLDQVIGLDTLLEPVRVDAETRANDVVRHLMTESTHPPLYFLLSHYWLKLFSPPGQFVSLWTGRSLSALLGVISIPASFWLGRFAFRSASVGQFTAALMAISPYGVYLAQEARHYTITILWILASLACLVAVTRSLAAGQKLRWPWVWSWVVINSLGTATHYFFALTLVAEALVLLVLWLTQFRQKFQYRIWAEPNWRKVYSAIGGSFVGSAVWLVAWQSIPDHQLTTWIYHGDPWAEFLEPIGRQLGWMLSMVWLLPIEGVPVFVAIASGVTLLVALAGAFLTWKQGWQMQGIQLCSGLALRVIGGIVLAAIGLILGMTYALGTDLTLAARYQFIYFPALLLSLGAALAPAWHSAPDLKRKVRFPPWFSSRVIVIMTLLLGLLGGLTVNLNLGYQKPDRPDLIVPIILEAHSTFAPNRPIMIATVHKTHEQTGEMMGIAWEFQHLSKEQQPLPAPQFLLAHKEQDATIATQTLAQAIAQIPRPFDLWLVNFAAPDRLETQNCPAVPAYKRKVPGYHFRLYKCQANS
jgi:uncharacterized membrane protein